jgi:hypothetical protein
MLGNLTPFGGFGQEGQVSREELVEAYLGGRISRRMFIRGLIAAGVSLTAAVAYSNVLGSVARATPRPRGIGDLYPPDLYPPDLYPPDLYPPEGGGGETAPKRREAAPTAAAAGPAAVPGAGPAEPVRPRKITFTG